MFDVSAPCAVWRSSAQRHRYRLKARWFWKGVRAIDGPPGLDTVFEVGGNLVSSPALTAIEDNNDDDGEDLEAILKFIKEVQSQRQDEIDIRLCNLAEATYSATANELCTVGEIGAANSDALDIVKTRETNSADLTSKDLFHPLDFLDLPDVAELILTCADSYSSKLGLDYFRRCCPCMVPEVAHLLEEDFIKSYHLDSSGSLPGSVSYLEPFPQHSS